MFYISLPSSKNSGFGLIELIVTIVILTIILSVVLFNQSTYTNSLSLNNDADEMSLRLSQAQAYGVGVREVTQGSGMFDSPYGLSISRWAGSGVSNSSYVFFNSNDGDNLFAGDWTCASDTECIEEINLSGDNHIDSICLLGVDFNYCNIGRVDVTFQRPTPEATMRFFGMGGGAFGLNWDIEGAKINLINSEGLIRSITVYTTGQISVQ